MTAEHAVISFRILAPGKLVLVGEYAVLNGAPAVVVAVDRGVSCEVIPAPALRIEAPDDRFVRPALEAVHAPPALYRFENWNPVDLPDKPGFGGSAAASVAACAAGWCAAGGTLDDAGRAAIEAAARRVHRAVQGSGSGIDVRAAARGDVRRFEGEGSVPLPSIPLIAVYSGRSAATGPRVQRYLAWGARDPRAARRFVDASRAIVHAFSDDPVGALRANYALLQAMSKAAGVDYDVPALARIVALARAFGGGAKPSGAGGGDVAVAIFPDPDARSAFADACRAEGFPPIPVRTVSGVARATLR